MAVLGDRVPMFKLRPYRSLLIAAILFAVFGGLISAYFFVEDSYDSEAHRGLLSLIVTSILVLVSLVAAFSRYRFSHLRHHRPGYKRG